MTLEEWANRIDSFDMPAFLAKVAKDECEPLLNNINRLTPVESGNLQSHNKTIANDNIIEITNPLEYSAAIEYGRRTENGGFISGRHFVRDGIQQWKRGFNQRISVKLEKELQNTINSEK